MRVKVYKCRHCGKVEAPPAHICINCRSRDLEETEIAGEGILYTYSTVYVPLASLEAEAPYTVAIVELDGGCRITGRLKTDSHTEPSIGARVELAEIRNGVYFFDVMPGESRDLEAHP